MSLWRVGKKVPINVYEGDRPVCQCHNIEDSRRIVHAMNVIVAMNEGYSFLKLTPEGFDLDFAPPVKSTLPATPHQFQHVEGNRFCSECGGGQCHPIHTESKPE